MMSKSRVSLWVGSLPLVCYGSFALPYDAICWLLWSIFMCPLLVKDYRLLFKSFCSRQKSLRWSIRLPHRKSTHVVWGQMQKSPLGPSSHMAEGYFAIWGKDHKESSVLRSEIIARFREISIDDSRQILCTLTFDFCCCPCLEFYWFPHRSYILWLPMHRKYTFICWCCEK